jgi:hypothetical protein
MVPALMANHYGGCREEEAQSAPRDVTRPRLAFTDVDIMEYWYRPLWG